MKLLNKIIVLFMPLVPKFVVKYFSKPYIAGAKLEDAVRITKELNERGMCTTIDVLGEDTNKPEEARASAEQYYKVIKAIEDNSLDANISIKLTQMGLKIDKDLCFEIMDGIIKEAAKYKNFVRIDMEDSSVTSDTIDVFLKLREKHDNVGIVLQSYLRRTLEDTKILVKKKASFRICKGIYVEPHDIAWKEKNIVNKNLVLITEYMLRNKCYVGIATHDEDLVWETLRIVHELNLKHDEYEFQMLLGVTEKLRKILVDEGHRLRVYVPFGEHWYAYSTRRLKENPQMAGYIIKSLFTKK